MEIKKGFYTPGIMDLLRQLKDDPEDVWYHAPMDSGPTRLNVVRYTVEVENPENSKVAVWTPETKTLVFKLGEHLPRFRLRGTPPSLLT